MWFHFSKEVNRPAKSYREKIECVKCEYIAMNKKDLHEHKMRVHAY